jgi:hypothetical protein
VAAWRLSKSQLRETSHAERRPAAAVVGLLARCCCGGCAALTRFAILPASAYVLFITGNDPMGVGG